MGEGLGSVVECEKVEIGWRGVGAFGKKISIGRCCMMESNGESG